MKTLTLKKAQNWWQKAKGLIGTNSPTPLYLETRWGIHTFGMRYPIDVIILNDENKIVKISSSLIPNRIFLWNPMYKKVLELPFGTITKEKLALGEKIVCLLQ